MTNTITTSFLSELGGNFCICRYIIAVADILTMKIKSLYEIAYHLDKRNVHENKAT